MIPLALSLHLLGASLSPAPMADLQLAPRLQLRQFTALDAAPAPAPAGPDMTNVHLLETAAGMGTYIGGEVVEGGLDLVFLLLILGGTLGDISGTASANSSNGLIVVGVGGIILVTLVAWVGIPLLVAEVEDILGSGMGAHGNFLTGALGAFVGQSVGNVVTLVVFALAGGFNSSSNVSGNNGSLALLIGGLLIDPLFSALGASLGLHFLGEPVAQTAVINPAPPTPGASAPPTTPPESGPYAPPPDYVAPPPPPPPLPQSTPAPVYPPSTFFMLPTLHFS
jgi:hypothetical protein